MFLTYWDPRPSKILFYNIISLKTVLTVKIKKDSK